MHRCGWLNDDPLYIRYHDDAMSRALKARGFRFVGSTTCYAFMQATGMVNDHVTTCYRWSELQN